MFRNASLTEITWTLIALSGMYPGTWNLISQVSEWKALRKQKVNHGAQFLAVGWSFVELIVLSAVVTCVVIGVSSMTVPEPPVPVHLDIRTRIIVDGLFWIGIAIALRSWLVFIVRRQWIRYRRPLQHAYIEEGDIV